MGCGSVSKDNTKTKRPNHAANFDQVPSKDELQDKNQDGQSKQPIKFDIELDEATVREQKLKKLYLMQKKKKEQQVEMQQKRQQIIVDKQKNQELNCDKQLHAKKRLPPLKKMRPQPQKTSTDIENENKEIPIEGKN